MSNEYLAKRFKVLTIKKQVSVGTFNQPASATDAVLLEDAECSDNWQTLKSTEMSGSVDAGETEVTHALPAFSGSFKLRGSGDVAQPPPGITPILESGGFEVTTKAVLPSSGKFTAEATSTTSRIDIDRAAGNGSQLPSTAAGCALLVGRAIEVDGNPATLRRFVIEKCTLAGTIVSIEVADVQGSAFNASSQVKILPGQLFDLSLAPEAVPVVSGELFEAGAVDRLKDIRTVLEFSVGHGTHITVKATMEGVFHNWGDATLPNDMNFDGRPSPAKWLSGRARFGKRALACTSLSANLGTQQTRHGDPEQADGIDAPFITGREATLKLQMNKVKPGTHDLRASIKANEKLPLVAALDIDGTAGTRWILIAPNAKKTGRAGADAEGIDDESLDLQAVRVSPLTTLRLFMF